MVVLFTAGIALFFASPSEAASNDPQLTVRRFCQDSVLDDGSTFYNFNFALVAENLQPKELATFGYRVPAVDQFFDLGYEEVVFPNGGLEVSFNFNVLAGDPRLNQAVQFKVIQGAIVLTEQSSLDCSPTENAPRSARECRKEVLLFFFRFYGFDFRTTGECIAFVSRRA